MPAETGKPGDGFTFTSVDFIEPGADQLGNVAVQVVHLKAIKKTAER
jgi:hypothetical protein